MKKISIFFIIMVSIMTFCLTRSKEIDEGSVVTEEEIAQYRNSLIETYEKYGHKVTDEEINKQIQDYKERKITIAKSKAKGMDFSTALKISIIVCFISCIVLFIIFHLKNAQYNELFGSSFGSDNTNDPMRGLRRFFFGRWF